MAWGGHNVSLRPISFSAPINDSIWLDLRRNEMGDETTKFHWPRQHPCHHPNTSIVPIVSSFLTFIHPIHHFDHHHQSNPIPGIFRRSPVITTIITVSVSIISTISSILTSINLTISTISATATHLAPRLDLWRY
uniref:Uncharacterized protein n=1 Tax=Molossus molossus TaxID=27622 RepID=A0A7J8IZA0_MOLMO|nr:hypothetical protein HJG59_010359 [Molossus molossus]